MRRFNFQCFHTAKPLPSFITWRPNFAIASSGEELRQTSVALRSSYPSKRCSAGQLKPEKRYRLSFTPAFTRSHVVGVMPCSRSLYFSILPVGVFGISSLKST